MLLPCSPHTHDVRTTAAPGAWAATSASPPSLEAPYTDWGLVRSHSTYGPSLVPSKT